MRCCPMCYCKAYLKNTGAMTCGTTMKLQYEISCSNCGLGPAKTGAVLMTYNEHNMPKKCTNIFPKVISHQYPPFQIR